MQSLELRTERLLLRGFRDGDRAPFSAMNADPRVMEHFPAIMTRAENDAIAERIRESFEARGFGLWAVEVPGQAEFIGFAGLMPPSFQAHFTPCIEVGWRLAAGYWGSGFAMRSRRVMEKLGMQHDKADDFEHPRLPEGHPMRKHVLYRLSRDAWVTRDPSKAP